MRSTERERNDLNGLEGNVRRFGCWNVRSMNGKEEELVAEMKKYRLEVVGVSETKVRGNGLKQIGDVSCVYSGVQEGRAKGGVAILLSGRFGAYLKEWKCVDERIVWIRLKIEGVWVTVVQVYAPTEDRTQSVKDEFYVKLQDTVGRVARGDLLIVMGDLNARVGDETDIWGEVLGRYGEEICNENGRRLLQFSSEHNLLIANTWFPHKKIHMYTWECRGRGLRSLIDYFLIGKEYRKQVVDVKAVRGAELGSDHYLVLLKIKLKVERRVRGMDRRLRQQIKINKLKEDEVRNKYQVMMGEMYEACKVKRYVADGDVEMAWKEMKEGIVGAARMVCGVAKGRKGSEKRTRWWNDEVKSAVRRKKVMYRQLLDLGTEEAKKKYNEAKVEAKRVVRRAKNEEWVQFGRELEKDVRGNPRRFWARVKGRGSRDSLSRIHDENGQVLVDEGEVIERWKEHFRGLYGDLVGPDQNMPRSEAAGEDDPEIMMEEVRRGVKRLKMRKAPGVCGVMPEMLKAGGEVVVKWLVMLFNMIWRVGVAPSDWRKAQIIPIYKKGSRLECSNYRGISLLSVVGKVYARVLNDRVKLMTAEKVMDEQGGFKAGRGCIDQIFAVRQIVEKTIEKDRVVYMAFVDLEKAYDNVNRQKLWNVLEEYGVRGRLLRAVEALYEDGKASVRVGGRESEWFGVHKGVRQGCTLSPWLFNVFVDKVTREARKEFVREVKLSTGEVGVLLFADDMVVMAESEEGLQSNLQALSDAMGRWDLKVNWGKTKVMMVARKRGGCEVRIGNQVIEQVEEMKYLGVMISSDGRMEKEVEARIGSATRTIGGMSEAVLRRKELSKSTKLKVVNATMMPSLLYGCEVWSLTKQQQGKVQATQMSVLRRIQGVSRLDRWRNEDIRQQLGQEGVLDLIRTRQEKWKCRLEEMSSDRTTKRVYVGVMEGRRPRGRPRMRWTDNFK